MKKEHIEIYYDHYKDTFEKISQEKIIRDKYFFYMLFLTMLILLSVCLPNVICELFEALAKEKINYEKHFDFAWVKSLIIFTFIWISFTYYRSCLNIDRLYNYIHTLEKLLKKSGVKITRESSNYLDNYPLVLSFIYRIYNIIIPLAIIILFIFIWIHDNKIKISDWKITTIFDTVSEFTIIIASLLYFLRQNIPEAIKKHILAKKC
jgi:hypothetical protein